MRKNISYLLIGLLLGSLIPMSSLFAASPIKLIINNQEINCTVQPQTINNRVMVSARDVAEHLGASVSWDASNNAVVISGGIQSGGVPSDLESSNDVINNANKNIEPTSNDNIIQQDGIWYANGRWLIETIEAKHPGKISGLTPNGVLFMSDNTSIELQLITINNRGYYSITEILGIGLLSESDLN